MAASSEKLPRHFEFSAARERTSWPITCSTRCLPNSIVCMHMRRAARAAGPRYTQSRGGSRVLRGGPLSQFKGRLG
eukprot:4542657-Prymnesium_polylepis.1